MSTLVTQTGTTKSEARDSLGIQDGPRVLPLCSYATVADVLTVVGRLRFDPSLYAISGRTLTLTLDVMGDVSSGALTGTVTLYDLTSVAVAATITVTSTSPGNTQTASVTVPGGATSYELRGIVAGGVGYLTLGAVLRLTWS